MSQLHNARDYDADADNRQILQDGRGVIFLANSKGLIEYDGARWSKVDSEGIPDVLCLTLGPKGRVFLGSFRDFGFLKADESGEYRFASLKDRAPATAREDQMYDRIFSDERRVYVQTDGNLYIWDCESEEMEVVPGLAGDSIVFVAGREVFATFRNEGVKVLRQGVWAEVDGLGFLSGANGRIKAVAKSEDGEVYLVTPFMGIYRFDGSSLEVFSEDGSFTEQWRNVNTVEVLSGGRLAVGTNLSGLWVFESDGSLYRHYERREGLSDAMVKDIMEDRQKGIWLVQEKGIVRLQAPSPMTLYGETHGIEGSIYFVEERGGILYLATASGAYASLKEEDDEGRAFRRIPGVFECKSLVSTEEGLIVGGSFSLYIVDGYSGEVIRDGWDASYLLRLKSNPSIILAAGYPGCGWLELVDGKWTFRGMIEEMDGKPVHGLMEDARGDVWFKSGEGITRRMTFTGTGSKVETFDQEDGLLSGWVSPLRVEDAVLATHADGRLLELDRETNRFKPSERFEYFPGEGPRGFMEFVRDREGVDWVSKGVGLGELIPRPAGWYILGMRSLSLMNDVRASGVYIEEDEEIVWVSVYDGLVRFDLSEELEFDDELVASVRAVDGLKDGNTIYGGDSAEESFVVNLSDDDRSVRVEVAGNSYWDTTRVEYRIFLEGVEERFPWFSEESSKTYTNIPYGEYTLWVEVRDALGRRSETQSMGFVVASPWYRTKVAYGSYFLLVGSFLYWIIRYWSEKFRRRNEQLRKQVEERTQDLAKKSKELEQHNFVLELRNDELKELARKASDAAEAKSRFLAMMSHEIRTPMNGVMGMCALMGNTKLSKEQLDFLDSIKASSDALLNIIDDILDYTKFEEGRLELEMISFDIIECVESVVTLLGPQATSRDIELYLKVEDGIKNWRLSDPTRVRQVLVNLIGNALKFTSKGYIAVSLSEYKGRNGHSFLQFKVRDTGIGIEKEKLELIFDPFSQADVSNVRRFGGTGLGLAICKHIVDRMRGEISVESEVGLGSTFTFSIPAEVSMAQVRFKDAGFAKGRRGTVYCSDPETRRLADHYLSSWGIDVVDRDTVSLFMRGHDDAPGCDFILIEHKLKSFDVQEIVDRFKFEDSGERVPVIIYVSEMTETLRRSVEKLSDVHLLAKPIIPSRLFETLGRVLTTGGRKPPALEIIEDRADSFVEFSGELRILVVEDNPINQKVAIQFLESMGYKPDLTDDGKGAIQAYRETDYDIIFMDIQMPEMDGVTATEHILDLSDGRTKPSIFGVSAGVMKEERGRCMEAGMIGFIKKPIRSEDLEEAIEKVTRRLMAG